jgi:hypothetical protein
LRCVESLPPACKPLFGTSSADTIESFVACIESSVVADGSFLLLLFSLLQACKKTIVARSKKGYFKIEHFTAGMQMPCQQQLQYPAIARKETCIIEAHFMLNQGQMPYVSNELK